MDYDKTKGDTETDDKRKIHEPYNGGLAAMASKIPYKDPFNGFGKNYIVNWSKGVG